MEIRKLNKQDDGLYEVTFANGESLTDRKSVV